jgi:hypothetical protein
MAIFLATLAGWLNRKQHDVIMYLNAENEILKEQFDKKGWSNTRVSLSPTRYCAGTAIWWRSNTRPSAR